jgi:SAM-dependent methyltransferase
MAFTGEVAENYARHRRGFPPPVVDLLVEALDLPREAYVLDLGCGTGQLTVPLAGRFDRVIGADPSPDMLRLARTGALAAGVRGIGWLLAADTDVGALPLLDGLDAVTISNAIHLLDAPPLFRALSARMSGRGRVAVVANGTPLWLQDSPWSRALRAHLEEWLGMPARSSCGTDPASPLGYRRDLAAAGFPSIAEVHLDYAEPLSFERVVGNVYSAMPPERLPSVAERPAFEARLRTALLDTEPDGTFVEQVRVAILVGGRLTSAGRGPSS